MNRMRLATSLDADTEALVHRVIGCAIAVHRELGPGLLERIYVRALARELSHAQMQFETERDYPIIYRGEFLCRQRVDLVVQNRVLLEIKAVERLAPVHYAQTMSYLRVSKLRVALLMNFNAETLPAGLRRILL